MSSMNGVGVAAHVQVAELKEERGRAFEELSASLEAISVKSLLDFRNRKEVPRPVQSVAVASICMVARVSETVEVGDDGLPPRTWEAAQANMAKPGHFVNSLRQFPYAVDSGRMSDANVFAARQCLQDVSPEHLAAEPVALALHRWIVAAWRYCEVVQILRLQGGGEQAGFMTASEDLYASAGLVQDASPISQGYDRRKDPTVDWLSLQGNGLRIGTPPMSPDRMSAGPAVPNARDSPMESPGQPLRNSLGSSVGGASVFGKSSAGASPQGSNRSSAAGAGGGAERNKVTTRRANALPTGYAPRRSQDSTQSSTLRVTPSGSPVSTRSPASRRVGGGSSPSQPATMPRRRPGSGASAVGYPRGPRSNVGAEDWQQKLDQMHREAREMKAMEAQLKWSMKREEDKQRKNDTREDGRDLMNWRQDRTKALAEYAADRREKDKTAMLRQSREFQESKRATKYADKEDEMQEIKDLYTQTKADSDWAVNIKKTVPVEERKDMVEDNLVNYVTLAAHRMEMANDEKLGQKLAREQNADATMTYQMAEAQKSRDEALQSLEFFRAQQHAMLSSKAHIASRPFQPNNQTL